MTNTPLAQATPNDTLPATASETSKPDPFDPNNPPLIPEADLSW